MTLGNDEARNFLPGNIQVDFDVFASTNYDLMQDLANNGFIDEAVPYISNSLDLMVNTGNPLGIGKDDSTGDTQFDIAMDLLSGAIIANKLDHINEGIHKASNGYMGKVHNYIRANDDGTPINMTYTLANGTEVNGTYTTSEWMQIALKNVAEAQDGSPGHLRATDCTEPAAPADAIGCIAGDAGETHNRAAHGLVARGCTYSSTEFASSTDPLLSGPTYKFCEFALLNKANTHESRVHHVEVPNGLVDADGYAHVDVGFVWITELAYQINDGNTAVTGMQGSTIGSLGIPHDTYVDEEGKTIDVNGNKTYSLALLATSKNQDRGREFINFLRDASGQTVYTDGGFTGLNTTELDAGRCYAEPDENGKSEWTPRTGSGSCPDWLNNGSF
jgi:ABC-type molybdate transport system substrate-binding protein